MNRISINRIFENRAMLSTALVSVAFVLWGFVSLFAQEEIPLRKPNPPKLPATYPEIVLPAGSGPRFYLNTEEVRRLRVAYAGNGDAANSLAKIVRRARLELKLPFSFPPKGGLHGSLYHCPECQRKLKPVLDESRKIKHHHCGKCDKQLSGFPYDDVYYTSVHSRNFKRGLLAAKAFILTNEDEYAVFVRDLLVGYADRYLGYKRTKGILSPGRYGHICSTDHEAGSLMMQYLGPMYDMTGHHPSFTRADHRHIKDDMIKPMMTYFDTATMRGKSNHHSFHNAGYIWGGVLTGDKTRIAQAIYGTGGGFIEQVRTAPSQEGLWPGGYSYHFYARRALVRTAEVARHINIDLYAEPQFKKMFFLPAQEVMPDGFTPNFGDDPGKYVVGRLGAEEGYAAYQDTALIPLLAAKATWESILAGRIIPLQQAEFENKSVLLPDGGHAILRGREPARFSLAMQFGKYGTSHTHFDKLSFILYGNGQQLGLDSGKRHSVDYESDVHQAYYRGTIGHNAIVVDGNRQRKNKKNCELLKFEAGGVIPYVGAASSELYDGVRQARWLAVAPEYVLVLDQMNSNEE
ncbi:MAG: heparinase II/III family protein, partial [Pirellulaceae bacterium]|nr:heparinase II/III family protein [Pirellulaceae bacterium]